MSDQRAKRPASQALLGILIIAAGVVFLLDGMDLMDAGEIFRFWPILLVIAGASLILRSPSPRDARETPSDPADSLRAFAFAAGIDRSLRSQDFRGGEITAMLGGCTIDLRNAAIRGEAVIDVFAFWGGIEIRVPERWSVTVVATPVLGGIEDATRPPSPPGEERLLIRGSVMMGGLEVKN